jgi:hypothetical protein
VGKTTSRARLRLADLMTTVFTPTLYRLCSSVGRARIARPCLLREPDAYSSNGLHSPTATASWTRAELGRATRAGSRGASGLRNHEERELRDKIVRVRAEHDLELEVRHRLSKTVDLDPGFCALLAFCGGRMWRDFCANSRCSVNAERVLAQRARYVRVNLEAYEHQVMMLTVTGPRAY